MTATESGTDARASSPTRSSRQARYAVTAVFAANGVLLATWTPRIPQLRQELNLSDATLGFALLAMSAGAVPAMQLSGWLVGRWGSRVVTLAAGFAFCASLLTLTGVRNLPTLVAALTLFGFSNGAMDVAMNAHGIAVQRRFGRPILSSMHAMFSLGAFAGAAFGGLTLRAGLSIGVHFAVASAASAGVLLTLWRYLLPAAVDQVTGQRTSHVTGNIPRGPESADSHSPIDPPVIGFPAIGRSALGWFTSLRRYLPRRVLLLGILGFCCLGEGAVGDWSAIYLHDELGTSSSFAATGYATFAVVMTLCRLTGDRLIQARGPVWVARTTASIGAAGFLLALAIHQPWAALGGFAFLGLGLACLIPLVFGAAGHIPGIEPGRALSVVATFSYGGSLLGPVLIGALSDRIGLSFALAVPGILLACVAVNAKAMQ